MTIKDIIEVLVHYDVMSREITPSCLYDEKADEVVGYCEHDNHTIVVDKKLSLMDRRNVIIHELAHAHLHIHGENDTEDKVNKLTLKVFHKLYPTYPVKESNAKADKSRAGRNRPGKKPKGSH